MNNNLPQILSLGLGVQSTTLLLMSECGELPLLDAAIFADTHFESRQTYQHLTWLRFAVSRIPIYIVSTGNLRDDVLSALVDEHAPIKTSRVGSPPLYTKDTQGRIGPLWRKCTRDYKVVPITRMVRKLMHIQPRQRLKEPVMMQWLGISVDEIQRASCSRLPWMIRRYPLIEQRMRRGDCVAWLDKHGYPTPAKSACIACPYHSDATWRSLRDTAPEDFADAIAFDEALREGGKRIPGTHGPAYVHRSAIPLRLVDFSTAEDKGQLNLFAEQECTGLCGV